MNLSASPRETERFIRCSFRVERSAKGMDGKPTPPNAKLL
jgi:hypothetical protein